MRKNKLLALILTLCMLFTTIGSITVANAADAVVTSYPEKKSVFEEYLSTFTEMVSQPSTPIEQLKQSIGIQYIDDEPSVQARLPYYIEIN